MLADTSGDPNEYSNASGSQRLLMDQTFLLTLLSLKNCSYSTKWQGSFSGRIPTHVPGTLEKSSRSRLNHISN